MPFTLFVNGIQVAESPGRAKGQLQHVPPFSVPLPPGDVTVAFRFAYPFSYRPERFPISAVEAGPLRQVQLAQQLHALENFDEVHVAEIVGIGLFLGLAAFAFVLFVLQRSRPEYLWLGLFCLTYSLTAILKILVESGALVENDAVMLLYRYVGCSAMVCSLEFVIRFAQVRWRPADRAIEALFLLTPLLGLVSQFHFTLLLVLCFTLLFVYVCACLIRAYRQGLAEIRVFLPLLALFVLLDILYYLPFLDPHIPSLPRVHLGSIGVGGEDVSVLLFLAGIMTVVLYRFHRVNREEQHAATEFRAARNLQQALIPEEVPSTPGFQIATAYQPAQEVGGDFFQVLPLPGSAGVLVAIGDVSGKGLEAAMTVAVIVGALRTLAEVSASPHELMCCLNRRLLDRKAGFCTCIILRLDPARDGVVCNAGHLSPYLDGQELSLDPGLPLGLTAEAAYTETAIPFALGQRLTLLTDGVVEARHPRTAELFGFARTGAISTHSAREIAAAALAFEHSGTQSDDITVLTIVRA